MTSDSRMDEDVDFFSSIESEKFNKFPSKPIESSDSGSRTQNNDQEASFDDIECKLMLLMNMII